MAEAVSYVAVLLRYWTERDENVARIVDDLRRSTVPPADIIVWDQSGEAPLDLGVTTIRSQVNYGSRARYAAAMLVHSPWYLFVDDDVTVEPTTVELMFRHARPSRVVGVAGLVGSDADRGRIEPGVVSHCDWLIGWLQLVPWRALVRFFDAEQSQHGTVGCEDMLMGRVNDCVVDTSVPYLRLPDHLVGQEKHPDASGTRHARFARIMEAGW